MTVEKTQRHDFDPEHVLGLLREGHVSGDEAKRMLESACHALVTSDLMVQQLRDNARFALALRSARLPTT